MDTDMNHDDPPPAYTEIDGRINIDLDSKFARAFADLVPESPVYSPASRPKAVLTPRKPWAIRLNVIIQVVGSRGDVQPFIALGRELQSYGHRIRIATHDCFASFVGSSGLEFFPIGGDPHDLMAYMVKNPGLIPSMNSLRAGDIQRKRVMVEEMLKSCWKSCIDPTPEDGRPFVADAIIANPPSFAHIHCAQALGVPLHLMFTMPWSSTRHFPHPLANLSGSQLNPGTMNYISYKIVEWMTWQGLGDIINVFRANLDLERIPTTVGMNLAEMLEIPFTYCWSPSLVPKPIDWPSYIDVCGFFFREQPDYSPSTKIEKFLASAPKPIYIGFGSIVLDNPAAITKLVLEAVQIAGVRAIISRGWSKLGSELAPCEVNSDNVLFIDDCPHEWLFQHVSLVVHHGGAGTTACGLRNACPTIIVPFFGDQPFWGNMVAAAGAGTPPISHKLLTAGKLSNAIKYCLQPSVVSAAQSMSATMRIENGVEEATQSFHANLPSENLACDILDDRPAVWLFSKKGSSVKLSTLAAQALIKEGTIKAKDLTVYQSRPIMISNPRWDPVTSIGSSGLSTIRGMGTSAIDLVASPYTAIRQAAPEDSTAKTTGKAIANIGKNFGKFNGRMFHGMIVDLPLAATEGLRAVPKLYGEKVQSQGEVTDVASGLSVAGKSFVKGMTDGVIGLYSKPMQGAKEEGALGFAKGAGKGIISLAAKTTSAAIGIVAYPGQGISKSLIAPFKSNAKNKQCDELKPTCINCDKYGSRCEYPTPKQRIASEVAPVSTPSSAEVFDFHAAGQNAASIRTQPDLNMAHLRLLHHFTTVTARTISVEPGAEEVIQSYMVNIAFRFPFLMQAILALAALHLSRLDQSLKEEYLRQVEFHHNAALAQFRNEIHNIEESNFQAVLFFTFIMFPFTWALNIHLQGDPEYILDNIIQNISFTRSTRPLAIKFYQPMLHSEIGRIVPRDTQKIDWEHELRPAETEIIQLRMFSEATQDVYPPDINEAYTKAIQLLEKIFAVSSRLGTAPSDSLLKIWAHFITPRFIELLTSRQPGALIIFAHYAVLFSRAQHYWFFEGVAQQILHIADVLVPSEWKSWLDWPREQIMAASSPMGSFEAIGYAGRAAAHSNLENKNPYIIQSVLILIAPILFAASIYMILGRLVTRTDSDSLSIIRPSRVTKIFVTGDVLCFFIQSGGAGMLVQAKDQDAVKRGENIILGGLMLQILVFGFFVVVAGVWHRRLEAYTMASTRVSEIPWPKYIRLLYAASACITIRNTCRVVEYATGRNGYLTTHEWPLYLYDFLPMMVVMIICVVWYDPNIKPHKQADIEMSH
ncbi:UDP-Glycosyltransferase/glycogen phosphorylase [Curvularia clavata]|uniref:UDP-Glycosyltransferase/glycogen phosphorylase n=1 Tax=Curvularia clavata TaxID=95742 RepID=A0A9Q8ZD50_CURCL|nr:UDP-Glycosyltransferase/glycogen phosphorylase [Curvularia clavata]